MYKKQLTFQKIVCLLAIISSVIVFIYSLGVMTDLYDSLYSTMMNPYDLTQTTVSGSIIYYDMQGFNQLFVKLAIVLILTGCFLFVTNTNIRRRYYIGNILATILYVGANMGVAVWAHTQLEAYKAQFLTTVDFEALAAHAKLWKTVYTESTFWFDAHYVVFGITCVACVLLLINLFWKFSVMKAEKHLVDAGKGVAA